MRHQNTCQNFYSKYQKKSNNIPKINLNQINNPKHRRTISLSTNIITKDFLCEQHHLNFDQYCLDCKEDICPECCQKNHLIHEKIKYEDVSLNEEQIN